MTPDENQPNAGETSQDSPAVNTTTRRNIFATIKHFLTVVAPVFTRSRIVVVSIFTFMVAFAIQAPQIVEFWDKIFHPESNTEVNFANSEDTSIDLDVHNVGRKTSYFQDDCRIDFGDLPVEKATLEIHPDDKARTTITPGPQHVPIRVVTRGLSPKVRGIGLAERFTKKEIKKRLSAGTTTSNATLWVCVNESYGLRWRKLLIRVDKIKSFILEGLPDDV